MDNGAINEFIKLYEENYEEINHVKFKSFRKGIVVYSGENDNVIILISMGECAYDIAYSTSITYDDTMPLEELSKISDYIDIYDISIIKKSEPVSIFLKERR